MPAACDTHRRNCATSICATSIPFDFARQNQVLAYKPKYMFWAGADLMHVTDSGGRKSMARPRSLRSPEQRLSQILRRQ